eukprot:CAMPEP_0197005634 /NCGR_PEP_ID=MMETSP1380-20130617/30464_1 /TAXON_ID=5936 /ORGANISM="Euplotes crassus, Strain CT5" /LENGTH=178 /DNA_ID=CAMNT_0042424839 /DNA_START=206 /DNA_END=742 /DNA_ORIENTATION=+
MQQEQANFHACDKASEGLKAEETKSSSPEQTSLPRNSGNPDNSEEAQETIKKRRRRSSKLEIRSKLIKVKSQILKRGISSFYSSPKQQRGSAPNNSSRRSRYIGISKNNTHWQALINIGRTKKYIDIFVSEQEAARTYDLYAIAIKGVKAGLNFNYTAAEMIDGIDHYLQHGKVMISS